MAALISLGFHRHRLVKHLLASAIFVGALSIPLPSNAAPLPRLVVILPADAGDCPDAPALALAVEKQMQHPALDATAENPATLVYEVQIEHSMDGYMATIRAGESTRDLSDEGASCAELADALALTLAIMLDNEAFGILDAEATPNSENEAPVPLEKPLPKSEPFPRQTPPPAPPRPMPNVSRPRPPHFGIAGVVAETLGFLTPFSFAFMPEAFVRFRSATFGLGGTLVIPWSKAGISPSQNVALLLATGTLSGCGRVWGKRSEVHFDVCGQSFVGAVHGEGNGFAVNRAGTRPWFALGAMGMLERPLSAHLDASLRLGLTVPIVRQRFTATPNGAAEGPVTLFEPPGFAGFLAAGIRWTIL